ncbi:MAG: hypothetical protein AAGK01_12665 [Pseudomonadota bacterium]
MSLRTSSAVIAVALVAACATESPAPEGDVIDCAIGPGSEYSKVCTLELSNGNEFLIHSPDGGFRRVILDPAAGEIGAVDGADPLRIIAQNGDLAEFEIGGDRYRVPHAVASASKE